MQASAAYQNEYKDEERWENKDVQSLAAMMPDPREDVLIATESGRVARSLNICFIASSNPYLGSNVRFEFIPLGIPGTRRGPRP